jgi:hypothetical protein
MLKLTQCQPKIYAHCFNGNTSMTNGSHNLKKITISFLNKLGFKEF